MSASEYMRWRGYERYHGSLDPAADRRAAVICKTFADLNRGDDDPYEVGFFLHLMRDPRDLAVDVVDGENDEDDEGGGDDDYGDEEEPPGY